MRYAECFLTTLVFGAACSGGGGNTRPDADADQDVDTAVDADVAPDAPGDVPEEIPPPPPERCRPGQTWTPDTLVYEEHTSYWGLNEFYGAGGAVADVDEDGWPDILLFQAPQTAADEPAGLRLLMNRPGGEDGRTFVDETEESGIAVRRAGTGVRSAALASFGDFNNDGHVDVVTGLWRDRTVPDTGDATEVLLNDGEGHFTLAAPIPGLQAEPLTSAIATLDQDLDGALDIFFAYWYRQPPFSSNFGQHPQLYRGDGAGAFTDVTRDVGIQLIMSGDASIFAGTNSRPLFGALACELTGDGRPDIVATAYARMWNLLWVSSETGYTEVGRDAGVAGDDELDYSDDQSYLCYCQANPAECPAGVSPPDPALPCNAFGGPYFRGWAPGVTDQPWTLNGNTFSVACEDVDNDGDMDLYTSDIAHDDVGRSSDRSELLINETEGSTVRFSRPGRAATGLVPPDERQTDEGGQSNGMWDFDNDGRIDVYLGGSPYPNNWGWLFHQSGDLQFEWVTRLSGFHPPCPNGLIIADFDRDGAEDVITGTQGCMGIDPPPTYRFFLNMMGDQNNWVSIRLVGSGAGGANVSAIGAHVRVTAGGVTQTREIRNSFGRASLSRELVAHFGLGATCAIDLVEVQWPDAARSVETFTDVVANYRIEVRQGEGFVRYLP
jgi:hypothetical protein